MDNSNNLHLIGKTSMLVSCFVLNVQTETKERVLNDNNANANVVPGREKETNPVEMSPKKRKVDLPCKSSL